MKNLKKMLFLSLLIIYSRADQVDIINNDIDVVTDDSYEYCTADYRKPMINLVEKFRDNLISFENPTSETFNHYIRFSEMSSNIYHSCEAMDLNCASEAVGQLVPFVKEILSKDRTDLNYSEETILALEDKVKKLKSRNLNLKEEVKILRSELDIFRDENNSLRGRLSELERNLNSFTVTCKCESAYIKSSQRHYMNGGTVSGTGYTKGAAQAAADSECRSRFSGDFLQFYQTHSCNDN